ncbi:hypothetical protein SEA_TINIBUG_64 [Mycobacterium Phage TiniBug]|uniref:Uncharacterized protein n=1 Tax=Mycobacterium phage Urkel TaxID=1912978 RepID=A0A1I9S4U5_9CAUD|nr:hypothetical protein I5H07_gp39 [Mycobacterium phage Urkel]AOZ61395.1 hypothetical protein SEA_SAMUELLPLAQSON_64 [Mycobacterium phage SamuelLPlaqson]AOZ61492.1 hypothetical protein SEA_DRHAYES_64 [Mycobacterium phage DrHayes]AOZ61589.1 hypothetical protein SEA_URKEL_64 [Mycobacterium phage Urkel]WNM75419.1 hypothetical protein SEA_TINIBUG_64 [Mycobacterium Phage TiniBug]
MSAGLRSTFTAKYFGRCGGCPSQIRPGDEVAFMADGGLIHVDCEDNSHEPVNARKRPTCRHCWLEHAGDCP